MNWQKLKDDLLAPLYIIICFSPVAVTMLMSGAILLLVWVAVWNAL